VRIRFTVLVERRAASSLNTTTFAAGRRAHAANSPITATSTSACQSSPRPPKTAKNSDRSRAYASTVFGERSIPVNHPEYSSTTATGRISGPVTVHDSTPELGSRTRCAVQLQDIADITHAINITASSDGNLAGHADIADIVRPALHSSVIRT
jgi:hypothetical protein